MKVILLQDIPSLGKKYEVKEVREGYARNFLLVRKLAKPATEGVLKELAAQKKREGQKREKEIGDYKTLAEKLKSVAVKIKAKTGAEGKIFGSVGAAQIAKALQSMGFKIEKNWIDLGNTIKTLGEHKVALKFPHGAEGELNIVVEGEW